MTPVAPGLAVTLLPRKGFHSASVSLGPPAQSFREHWLTLPLLRPGCPGTRQEDPTRFAPHWVHGILAGWDKKGGRDPGEETGLREGDCQRGFSLAEWSSEGDRVRVSPRSQPGGPWGVWERAGAKPG